jgi:hypothetical protein
VRSLLAIKLPRLSRCAVITSQVFQLPQVLDDPLRAVVKPLEQLGLVAEQPSS